MLSIEIQLACFFFLLLLLPLLCWIFFFYSLRTRAGARRGIIILCLLGFCGFILRFQLRLLKQLTETNERVAALFFPPTSASIKAGAKFSHWDRTISFCFHSSPNSNRYYYWKKKVFFKKGVI